MIKNLFLIGLSIIVLSCQSGTETKLIKQLQGSWSYSSASINGSLENGALLSGVEFLIQDDSISSNIFDQLGLSDPKNAYKVNGETIQIAEKLIVSVRFIDEQRLDISFEHELTPDVMSQFDISLKRE